MTVYGMRKLLSEFHDWEEDRAELSENDGRPGEWHDSDDAAFDLLDRIAAALEDVLDNHWKDLVGDA